MHSNRTNRPMLRMTPYLITVGLGISTTANAAQAPEEVQETEIAASDQATVEAQSEIPAPTIDTDGDGVADAWDRNGDKKPDAWDTDGDGKPDLLDDNGDGKPD